MYNKITYLLIILLVGIYSCSDNSKEGPMGPVDQVITVTPSEVTVKNGETVTFTAVGGTGTYFWEISQPSIGTISSIGEFTALRAGEATIICKDTQNLEAMARVKVTEYVVQIVPSFPTIEHESTFTFTATGGSSTTYFWWCDPPTLYGTISQQGIFTSKNQNGTVAIYAADGSNNVGIAHITVRGVSVRISPSTVVLHTGDTQEFEVSGGTAQYLWVSSNTSVGTIEATGSIVTFTAVAVGTTTITVTDSDNFTGTAEISVVAVTSDIITVIPETVSVAKTGTYQFSALGGTGGYVWSLSNPSVGTISSTGLFTAGKNAGTATVTATDTYGNVGTATVSVVNARIDISPSDANLTVGSTMTFVGTGGLGSYWWSVTDTSTATITTQTQATSFTTLTAVDVGTITLYAVDNNGNSGSVSVTIK